MYNNEKKNKKGMLVFWLDFPGMIYKFKGIFYVRTKTYQLQINFNPFMPTVPTFAVRETDISWHNGGNSGVPLKPLRDDSALGALSTLRGLRGAPEVPHYKQI